MSLADARVGDEVAVWDGWSNRWAGTATITGVRDTQLIVGTDRYSRKTGRRIRDHHSRSSIQPLTQALREQMAETAAHLELERRINHARQRLVVDRHNIDRIEALIAERNERMQRGAA